MIVLFDIGKQTTKITMNGHTTEHKTVFLKRLSFKDVITWVESENKKLQKGKKIG